jgi:hypothetical protein
MQTIITGAVFVLHGVVHLLYFGQSRRIFELRPKLVWPDGSWAFSKILGDETTRLVASIALILTAAGFVAGGLGIFTRQAWWRPLILVSAALSAAIFVLFWDGKIEAIDAKGGVGLLISVAILTVVLILDWPS